MIIEFLKTERSKKDLKITLDVINDFKDCESDKEYFLTPFVSWTKLEQLTEYLEHLISGKSLKSDTIAVLKKEKTNMENKQ